MFWQIGHTSLLQVAHTQLDLQLFTTYDRFYKKKLLVKELYLGAISWPYVQTIREPIQGHYEEMCSSGAAPHDL